MEPAVPSAPVIGYMAVLPPLCLHSSRNFFRALPCKLLASAWAEHSFETAILSPAIGAGAGFVAAAGAAGFAGVICAIAALAPNSATIPAIAREDFNFMTVTSCLLSGRRMAALGMCQFQSERNMKTSLQLPKLRSHNQILHNSA
jgi:hypothetical protein